MLDAKFDDGATGDKAALAEKGFLSLKSNPLVKILGSGEVTKKLNVVVAKVSESAKAKIEKAGGSVKTAETSTEAEK